MRHGLLFLTLLGFVFTRPTLQADEPATPAPVPAMNSVTSEQSDEFATRLLKVVTSNDSSRSLIDWSALNGRVAKGLEIPEAMSKEFLRGMLTVADTERGLIGAIRIEVQNGGSYKYLRSYADSEGTRVKFRFVNSQSGVNYHDFLLREDLGKVKAVDVRVAMSGEDLSETMRPYLIQAVASTNRGFLERLTKPESALVKSLSDIVKMTSAINENAPETALSISKKLPAEIRDLKSVMILELKASMALMDTERMSSVIGRFRQTYPTSPAVDLMSIDYFALKNDLNQALISAERFMKANGPDAHILSLMANLNLQSGQLKLAQTLADSAVKSEPNYQFSRIVRIDIALAQKDFVAAREGFEILVRDFGTKVDLNVFRNDPASSEFVASPEFERLDRFIKKQAESAVP